MQLESPQFLNLQKHLTQWHTTEHKTGVKESTEWWVTTENALQIGQRVLQGTLDFNLSLPKFQSFARKNNVTLSTKIP